MCLLCCSSLLHKQVRTPRIYQNNQEQHLHRWSVGLWQKMLLKEEEEDVEKPPSCFPWALSSCTGFCDTARATEGPGGADSQHQTSHPPQTLQHVLRASTENPTPLTPGEDLLSLRFSSANNLGVKVLQEVLESFKLCSHGDYCLISEWRSRGCSQEQELDVLNSDLEDFHPCISVFGVHWPCKKKHWRLKRKAGLAAFWNPASFPQLSFAPQWQQWGQGSGEPSHYHTRSWACTAAPESPNRNVPPNSPNSSQERLFCSAAWILLLSLGIIIQRAK